VVPIYDVPMATRHRLSPHFVIEEFDCHDGHRVPTRAIKAYERLCALVLEPLRERYGVCHVVSGYRDPAYNARVGGARMSAHMCGDDHGLKAHAADVHFAHGRPSLWGEVADDLLTRHYSPGGGLGVYPSGGWIHIDDRTYRARWTGAG
jgi:uncharacterized protein YcbK (DUF882 family)